MDKSSHCWYLLHLNSKYNKGTFRVSGFPSVWPINCPYEGFPQGARVLCNCRHEPPPPAKSNPIGLPKTTGNMLMGGWQLVLPKVKKTSPCCNAVDPSAVWSFDLNEFASLKGAFAFIALSKQKCTTNHWWEVLKSSIKEKTGGINEAHWRKKLLLRFSVWSVSMLPVLASCCNQKVCAHTKRNLFQFVPVQMCQYMHFSFFFIIKNSHDFMQQFWLILLIFTVEFVPYGCIFALICKAVWHVEHICFWCVMHSKVSLL